MQETESGDAGVQKFRRQVVKHNAAVLALHLRELEIREQELKLKTREMELLTQGVSEISALRHTLNAFIKGWRGQSDDAPAPLPPDPGPPPPPPGGMGL